MPRLLQNARGLDGGIQRSADHIVPDANPHLLFFSGDWDGAEVTVELSPDGHEWFEYCRVGEKAFQGLKTAPGVYIRASITRNGPATRLDVTYV